MRNLKVRMKLSLILVLVFILSTTATICLILAMQTLQKKSNETLESELNSNYDNIIKEQVESVISIADYYNNKYQRGECTLEEAQKISQDIIREIRYGENGYFWIDDYNGKNIVLLGSSTEGTDRIEAVDVNGVHYMQEIIQNGKQPEGGYSDYAFPKEGETEASPKRAYSKAYEPFGWVIGTGNYIDEIQNSLNEESTKINQIADKWMRNMCLFIGFIFALIIIVAIWLMREIIKPLDKVKNSLAKIQEGNMTEKLDDRIITRKDEFGELGRAVQSMAKELDQLIGKVKRGSIQLTQNVDNIKDNMENLSGDIESISATTEELSASMQETAASTEYIGNMSEEIATVSRNIAARAQEGTEMAIEIHKRADIAKQDTISKRERAMQLSNEIEENLHQAIEEASVVNDIMEFTESIMEITSKTNLLALNASIEAARAGEAGKGFAVVAGEIQTLAEQSKSAVQSINSLAENVINAVKNLSDDSQKLLEFMKVDVTNDFNSFLKVADTYDADASYVNDLLTEYSAISEELLSSIENIMESINCVNTATSEGALGTTEIAKMSTEITRGSKDIVELTEDAGTYAEELKQQVEHFVISEA